MGRAEWYRRQSWTETDEAAFFARLSRSRGAFNKIQYLRIQAHFFQEAELPNQALRLLELAEADYPNELGQMTGVLEQKAACLWSIGDRTGSFDSYVGALAATTIPESYPYDSFTVR
jgi:hypothetical protein